MLKFFKLRYTFMIIDKIFDWFKIQSLSDVRRIIKLCTALIILIHIMGCMNIFISDFHISDSQGWLLLNDRTRDESRHKIYVTSWYWASVTITTVGYGDIIPTNNDEVLFTVIIIVLGSIFYSIFISVVANFFKTIDETNVKINNYKGSSIFYSKICEI